MGASGKTLYTLLPIHDEFGEQDLAKTQRLAKFFAACIMLMALSGLSYNILRLVHSYGSVEQGDTYYAVLTALTSLVGIHALSFAFGFLYFLGVLQKQESLIFLWIISVFVLLSLTTLVTVYHSAIKDHQQYLWSVWGQADIGLYILELCVTIPGLIVGVALYRAIQHNHQQSADQREILL